MPFAAQISVVCRLSLRDWVCVFKVFSLRVCNFEKTLSVSINMPPDVAGNVEEKEIEYKEEKEIEWKINNFNLVTESKNCICSPNFSFAGAEWCFYWIPKFIFKEGFMKLLLHKKSIPRCLVEYDFGLKKQDGSLVHSIKGIIQYETFVAPSLCIELSKIQLQKYELAPSNVLTFTCRLKGRVHATHSDQPRKIRKLEKFINLNTLSENFESLLHNKESFDTTLLVMNKEYKAHRAVLMARSSVFAAMFLHETSEKQTGIVTISDCDPESFETFLQFLYSGKLEHPSPCTAHNLYETSEKYDVQDLKMFCSDFLMENITIENFCDVLIMADKYNETKLLSAAQCFFYKNLNSILVTSKWDSLQKNSYCLAKKLLVEMSLKVKVVE